MAIKEENTRLSLTISKELETKVQKLAEYQNISKNAVINNLIEMSIDAQIQLWGALKDPDILKKFIDVASKMGDESAKNGLEKIGDIMSSTNQNDIDLKNQTDELLKDLKK
jgi:hypothetical protein